MARKDLVQDTVSYPGKGLTVDIFYSNSSHKHYAHIGGQRIEHSDIDTVRRLVHEEIRRLSEVSWFPVISVRDIRPDAFDSASEPHQVYDLMVTPLVGFLADRFYVARLPNGRMRKCKWEFPEDEREAFSDDFYWPREAGEFAPPCARKALGHGHNMPTRYFPYTPELWDGLAKLKEQLVIFKERVTQMLDPATGGALLLPKPDPAIPPTVSPIRLIHDGEETYWEPVGPDSFGGSDEGSHYMAQTRFERDDDGMGNDRGKHRQRHPADPN